MSVQFARGFCGASDQSVGYSRAPLQAFRYSINGCSLGQIRGVKEQVAAHSLAMKARSCSQPFQDPLQLQNWRHRRIKNFESFKNLENAPLGRAIDFSDSTITSSLSEQQHGMRCFLAVILCTALFLVIWLSDTRLRYFVWLNRH